MKFDLCGKSSEFFATKKCEHYLTICNLCNETTYCEDHGCLNCKLEKDANTSALSVINDETRETLLLVSERQQNLTPAKRDKTDAQKKTKAGKVIDYKLLWLDDLISFNILYNDA